MYQLLSARIAPAVVAVAAWLTAPDLATAAIANFWLSEHDASNMNAQPEAPEIFVEVGTTARVEVWTRPAPGLTLIATSLNLVSETGGVLTFEDVEVHNPPHAGGGLRHQLTYDSDDGLNPQANEVYGFNGLSVLNDAAELEDGGGIGPECETGFCVTGASEPSWHFATITFDAAAVEGTTELYLEISDQGIWHAEEDPVDTSAVFGLPDDFEHEWTTPLYCDANPARCTNHRDQHLGLPDAVIQVVSALPEADFDDDLDVDGRDWLTVQSGFGAAGGHAQGDADFNGVINATDVVIWQSQYGLTPPAAPATVSVPEPAAALLAWVASAMCWRWRRLNESCVVPVHPVR